MSTTIKWLSLCNLMQIDNLSLQSEYILSSLVVQKTHTTLLCKWLEAMNKECPMWSCFMQLH
jgi:hypothetical protein